VTAGKGVSGKDLVNLRDREGGGGERGAEEGLRLKPEEDDG